MPLPEAGVQFVSPGFDSFMRNMGEAAKTIVSFGRMTENRMAALKMITEAATKSLDTMASTANRTARQVSQAYSSINRSMSGKAFQTSAVTSFGGIGGMIGAAVGSIIPGMGTAIGSAVGQVSQVLITLFIRMEKTLLTFSTGLIRKIASTAISVGKAFLNFGAKIVTTIWGIIKTVGSAIGNLFSSIIGFFTGGAGGGWRSLGGTIFGAMFKFEILKQIIRGIINEIKDLANSAVGAAASLQTLTARLDFLIASQAQAAGVAKDFNSAMGISASISQDLLKWMQKLALASPIGIDDVAHTTSLAIAMGWAVDEAKTLTKAIVDYTAATGLGSEISERIIYNFAQMKQQGKVTGTELRDLGRGAFMPITRILEIMYKNMGETTMSFQEFRDEAAAGTIEVGQFFTAFEEFVAVFMPDAAYKMNYTFEAVKNNLSDLFKILLGWNVLGPVIKSLTKPLQDFIEKFQSDQVLLSANRIGKALAYMVEAIKSGFGYVTNAVGALMRQMGLAAPSIRNVVQTIVMFSLAIKTAMYWVAQLLLKLVPVADMINDKFGKTFGTMRSNFFVWGANLVVSFAAGMVRAAAKVLTIAINFIAKILTSWFKTGSPPKILPDIDKWGMETINEWLHGFTQADFGILDDMKGAVKDALGALVNLGTITDVQSMQMYVDYSIKLMQAMDEFNRTGNVSVGIFDELRNIGGVYGKELAKLFDLELQLAIVTEQATQAQKDYDNAIRATLQSETKTNKLIREYNTMLRKGADRNTLKNKLSLVNASEMELSVNRRAEIIKKSALDTANDQQKAMEDQVKLQQSLIKGLTDLAQANKEASGSAADLAQAIEGLGEDIGAGFDIKAPWTDEDLKMWIDQAEGWFNTWLTDTFPTIWGNAGEEAFGPNSEFTKALNGIKSTLAGIFGTSGGPNGTIGLDNYTYQTFGERIGQAIFDGTVGKIKTAIEEYDWKLKIWQLIVNTATKFFGIGEAVTGVMTGNGIAIANGLGIAFEAQTLNTKFVSYINNATANILKAIETGLGVAKGLWQSSPLYRIGQSIIEGIKQGIKSAYKGLQTLLAQIGINLPDILEDKTKSKSPSKVFEKIGVDLMLGLQRGISLSSGLVQRAMLNSLGGMAINPSFAMQAPMSAPSVYNGGNSLTFGDISINNNMDAATFKALVQKAIME